MLQTDQQVQGVLARQILVHDVVMGLILEHLEYLYYVGMVLA